MRRLGLGLIGLGMASAPHAQSLLDLSERVDVRAAFSPSVARRAAFCGRYGFPPAQTLGSILNDPQIMAVLLLTPPNARLEIVRQLAGAGKHILMEKPVERTSAAACAVVEMCEHAGVKLAIVFQHRFRQSSQKLKELLDRDAFGPLATVQLNVPWWRPQGYYDEAGRGSYDRDGGGVLISQAIHAMDLMLSLTGPVSEVAAIAGTSSMHRLEGEDFVGGGLRFEGGAIGSISASTAHYPGEPERLVLVYAKATAILSGGMLEIHWLNGESEMFGERQATGGGADPMAFAHDWHRAVIEDFLDAIEQDRSPRVSGQDALEVHHLIDALILSSRQRRHVAIEEIRT